MGEGCGKGESISKRAQEACKQADKQAGKQADKQAGRFGQKYFSTSKGPFFLQFIYLCVVIAQTILYLSVFKVTGYKSSIA